MKFAVSLNYDAEAETAEDAAEQFADWIAALVQGPRGVTAAVRITPTKGGTTWVDVKLARRGRVV